MDRSLTPSVCALIALSSIAWGEVKKEAPAEDRRLAAALLREVLVKELAKAAPAGTSEERHREEKEIKIGPIKRKIVTYWRSKVSGNASFPDPEKNLTVDVPKMVRGGGTATLNLVASTPVKGNISGEAKTDDGKIVLVRAGNSFTCKLTITAECVVRRVKMKDAVSYQIEVKNWAPTITESRFGNALADLLRGPIEKAANEQLKRESEKLRGAINDALKKAYEGGKLKIPE